MKRISGTYKGVYFKLDNGIITLSITEKSFKGTTINRVLDIIDTLLKD